VNVKLNFWVRYTLLMAGETSAASLRCVSPLASGSTVVACRPAALASSSVAQRYRSPTKISRFYLRYLAYRDILGQNLDILSGPRYLGSDPRYLPYLVISVGALVILPTEISRSKSRYLAWSGPQTRRGGPETPGVAEIGFLSSDYNHHT
jgi:hypothetical protein